MASGFQGLSPLSHFGPQAQKGILMIVERAGCWPSGSAPLRTWRVVRLASDLQRRLRSLREAVGTK
jgi:hypothetical protein